MAVRTKGKRPITVDGTEYLWWRRRYVLFVSSVDGDLRLEYRSGYPDPHHYVTVRGPRFRAVDGCGKKPRRFRCEELVEMYGTTLPAAVAALIRWASAEGPDPVEVDVFRHPLLSEHWDDFHEPPCGFEEGYQRLRHDRTLEAAIRYCEAALVADGRRLNTHFYLGRLLEESGELAAALSHYESEWTRLQAIASPVRDTSKPDYLLWHETARHVLEHLGDAPARRRELLVSRARVHLAIGHRTRGLALYRQAASESPDDHGLQAQVRRLTR